MTRNKVNPTKFRKQRRQATENDNFELETITLLYDGKEYIVEFPKNANATVIRQTIMHETGVKGLFYVHFGDQLTNYLHCSSITGGNLAKLAGGNGKFWFLRVVAFKILNLLAFLYFLHRSEVVKSI